MRKQSARYLISIFILLVIQACSPFNEEQTGSEIAISNDTSTLRMSVPPIIANTRAVDSAELGVEVIVTYTASGTEYEEMGLATRSDNSSSAVWELAINVPANTSFNLGITWFEERTSRLNLIRSSRAVGGLTTSSSLSFTQDFTSIDDLSNNQPNEDFTGFDIDADTVSNLQELIDGTDPFDASDPIPDNDSPPGAATPLIAQPSTIIVNTESGSSASASLVLQNSDDEARTFSISSDSDWLGVTPASGSISAGASASLSVSASCDSSETVRMGIISVESGETDTIVPVQLNCVVTDSPPSLNVVTAELELDTPTATTATGSITFTNSGGTELSYEISSNSNWLTVSPSSGLVQSGATENVQVSAACENSTIPRSGLLTIDSDGGDGTVEVSVTCTPVAAGPMLSDTPEAPLNLSASTNESATDTISFANSGDTSMSYSLSTENSWLVPEPMDGILSAGETAEINVTGTCGPEPTTLQGSISLVSDGGSATIDVVLECQPVEPAPTPTGLIISASVGETNGTFLSGTPPVAAGNLTLSDFDDEVLETIISGGSVELPIVADQGFSRIYVVTEPERYFDIQLPQSTSSTSLILTANTELNDVTETEVSVQVETPGAAVSAEKSVTITTLEVGTGELQISVNWDQPTDVDLYLLTPSGDIIFFNMTSVGDGMLDLDSNANCFIDNVNNENISFGDNAAPPGQYSVFLAYFSDCEVTEPTQYVVTIRANNTTETFTGSFNSSDVQSDARLITTIEIR